MKHNCKMQQKKTVKLKQDATASKNLTCITLTATLSFSGISPQKEIWKVNGLIYINKKEKEIILNF